MSGVNDDPASRSRRLPADKSHKVSAVRNLMAAAATTPSADRVVPPSTSERLSVSRIRPRSGREGGGGVAQKPSLLFRPGGRTPGQRGPWQCAAGMAPSRRAGAGSGARSYRCSRRSADPAQADSGLRHRKTKQAGEVESVSVRSWWLGGKRDGR